MTIAREIMNGTKEIKVDEYDFCNHPKKERSVLLFDDNSMILCEAGQILRQVYKSTLPAWAK